MNFVEAVQNMLDGEKVFTNNQLWTWRLNEGVLCITDKIRYADKYSKNTLHLPGSIADFSIQTQYLDYDWQVKEEKQKLVQDLPFGTRFKLNGSCTYRIIKDYTNEPQLQKKILCEDLNEIRPLSSYPDTCSEIVT